MISGTALAWISTWSSQKNIKKGDFNAIDACISIHGTYAIDSSYNIWRYTTSDAEKKDKWTKLGATGVKIFPLALEGIIYIDESGIVTYLGTSIDEKMNSYL